MAQNLRSTNSFIKLEPVELRSYFLQLPGQNVFSLILLNIFWLIIAMPLIIINAGLLELLPIDWLHHPVITSNPESPTWLAVIQAILVIVIIFLLFYPLCRRCIDLGRYYLRPRPTEEEYDLWVRNHIPALRQYGIVQLNLDPSEIIDEPECLQGIVWPSSKDAKYYQGQSSPAIKWDRTGLAHGSINRFIFFYPTRDVLAIFTCDINALDGNKSYRNAQTYFYKDITGFENHDIMLEKYPMYQLKRLEVQAGARSLSIPISDPESAKRIVSILNTLLRDYRGTTTSQFHQPSHDSEITQKLPKVPRSPDREQEGYSANRVEILAAKSTQPLILHTSPDSQEENDLTNQESLQRLSKLLSRLHPRSLQGIDELIGDLKAQRTLKPITNSQDSRPFSVTIAAIATAVNGGLYLLTALSLFTLMYETALFHLFYSTFDVSLNVGAQDVLIGAVVYFAFLGIVQLPLSQGLLQCKYGAYWGIMGIEGSAILVQLIIFIFFHSSVFFFAGTFIPILILACATYGFHGTSSRIS